MKSKDIQKLQVRLDWYFSTVIANSQELDEKSENWTIRREIAKIVEKDLEGYGQFDKIASAKDFIFNPNNVEHIRMYLLHEIKQIDKKGNIFLMLKNMIYKTNFDYKTYAEFYVKIHAQLTSHGWGDK